MVPTAGGQQVRMQLFAGLAIGAIHWG